MEINDKEAGWLIHFVRTDPDAWTLEDMSGFEETWSVLLRQPPHVDLFPQRSPVIRIREFHKELSLIVKTLEEGGAWGNGCRLWRQLRLDGGSVLRARRAYIADRTKQKKEYLTRVMDILYEANMMLCKRQDCRKLFVRFKRQEYCSGRCRGTVNKRKYREIP